MILLDALDKLLRQKNVHIKDVCVCVLVGGVWGRARGAN